MSGSRTKGSKYFIISSLLFHFCPLVLRSHFKNCVLLVYYAENSGNFLPTSGRWNR